MKLLIKFPSRGRPEKFKSTFEQYYRLLSNKREVKFVFTFDTDDETMNNDIIKNFLQLYSNICEINYGDSKNKIEAINANLQDKQFDVLLLASDDLIPYVQNYDDIICSHMEEFFPDTDGSIQYYTPMWADTLDIMCILGFKYFKRFNYIYHPAYKGLFCDNEFTDIKKKLNKNKFVCQQLFDHNYTSGDPTSWRSNFFQHEDWRVYEDRKLRNFDL